MKIGVSRVLTATFGHEYLNVIIDTKTIQFDSLTSTLFLFFYLTKKSKSVSGTCSGLKIPKF